MAKSTPKKNPKVGKKPEKLATPTGLHTPMTNVAVERASQQTYRVEPDIPEGAKVSAPPSIAEFRASRFTEETVAEDKPLKELPDIGRASFKDPEFVLETVHGPDNRQQVKKGHTTDYPWSAHASLLITARDGSQWIGTGWFISPRTLVTAGHCVYIKASGIVARDGWVKAIQVLPGRHENIYPFGKQTSMQFFSVKGWVDNGDENYDYGAIILPAPFTKNPGALGFEVRTDAELTKMTAYVSGYPGDQPSGTLWFDTKQIASVTSSKVFYDIDTAGGQSGAAVFRREANQAYAIAVHAYGGATTNSGTRISPPMFANLKNWSL